MGVYGTILNNNDNFGIPFLNYDINSHSMYNGIDWVYSYVETLYMYDYKVVYFWLLNSVYDESIDFFFLSVWYVSLQTSALELFWSVILDKYILSNLSQFSLTDEWVRSYIASKDSALFVIYHPEVIFFKNQILNNFFFDFLTDVNISALQYLDSQSLITPIMLFPQLLFVAYIAFFFVSFYFSYYSTATKEESTIDSDYLSASITIESEKELGSVDDILMAAVILLYTFGWYFYLYCWTLISAAPELVLVFFFFPALYYTILSMPTLLLFDFGIVFIAYVQGASKSSVMLVELMFDYVAIISFYVRVITQAVRLLLMIGAYAGMHDFILFSDYSHRFLTGNESIWEEVSNVNASVSSFTYFFLGVLPGFFLNWMYEVVHTFFVVTGQLVAYLGMIFWLFLFLFTFFVSEKQENYFEEKRKQRQDLVKKIRNLNK